MWPQTYTPVSDSLPLSALVAALPVFVVLTLLGILRKPAWMAALSGLGIAAAVALLVYRMPIALLASSCLYGAAYGILPIGWIVFTALLLYRLTVETGKFEIIKDSIGSLTSDQRLQALLIAFAFGAFIEGACGFGTPVAVAAAMLAGWVSSRSTRPASACSRILRRSRSDPSGHRSSCSPPSPGCRSAHYLPTSAASARRFRCSFPRTWCWSWEASARSAPSRPPRQYAGSPFGATQFLVSSYLGPHLTDILGSIAAMGSLVVLLQFWKPKGAEQAKAHGRSTGEILLAWSPYILLIIFVLLWGLDALPVKAFVNRATITFAWPGLHNLVTRMPPVTAKPSPYAATFAFNWLAASGTSCLLAVFASAMVLRVSPRRFAVMIVETARQMLLPMVTICKRAGARVPDELFRRDRHAGVRVLRHRRDVPVLQRAARLAGSLSHRQRYLRQRVVRKPASGDGESSGIESRA
jgi:hypothetical protein